MPSFYAHIVGKKIEQKNRNVERRFSEGFAYQNLFRNKKDEKKSSTKTQENIRQYCLFLTTADNGLTNSLHKLWLANQLCDVELIVGKESIKAHKVS